MIDPCGLSKVIDDAGVGLDFVATVLLVLATAARRGGIVQSCLGRANATRMMVVDAKVDDVKDSKCGHWSGATRLGHAHGHGK